MAYVNPDYPTKKDFRAAVLAGLPLTPYNPSGMFDVPQDGRVTIEGPHYPKPHRWYADCDVKDGIIVKVR